MKALLVALALATASLAVCCAHQPKVVIVCTTAPAPDGGINVFCPEERTP